MFASICRRVLHENVAPVVADRMPWLGDGFQVLEDISMNNELITATEFGSNGNGISSECVDLSMSRWRWK